MTDEKKTPYSTKKVINGKMYNTETARLVCHRWVYNKWFDERDKAWLYRKKTGEFFIVTEEYEGFMGEPIRWVENFTPLSLDEAKEWVEDNCNYKYEDIFGPVDE